MKRYSPDEIRKLGKTMITAHSGCENTPPNSEAHILSAIDSGAEMIEVDVRKSDTGKLYLSHDLPSDADACVALERLFELVKSEKNLCMNLDVKTEGLIRDVTVLSDSFGITERIVFTGACNRDRELCVKLGADMWRSMWNGEYIPDGISENTKDKSPYLNVYYPMITPEYNKALLAVGGRFSAWTVDNEEALRHFLHMGIGNITTRKPVLALRLRREIQGI